MRGDLQQVVVDGFKLMRQRVDAGDGQREVGVVLVGQSQPHGLDAQAEPRGVPVEWLLARGWLTCKVAICSGERIGSCTWPVRSPLPISLTDAPSGTITMTCTGSGSIGPVTITLG